MYLLPLFLAYRLFSIGLYVTYAATGPGMPGWPFWVELTFIILHTVVILVSLK